MVLSRERRWLITLKEEAAAGSKRMRASKANGPVAFSTPRRVRGRLNLVQSFEWPRHGEGVFRGGHGIAGDDHRHVRLPREPGR